MSKHSDPKCYCPYDCLCTCQECQEDSLRYLMEERPTYREEKERPPAINIDWKAVVYDRTTTRKVINDR